MVTGPPLPNVQSSQGVLQGLNTKPGSRLQESSLKIQSPQSSSVNNWCVCFYILRNRTQQEAGPLLTASRSTYVHKQKAPGSKGCVQVRPAAPGSLGTCPSRAALTWVKPGRYCSLWPSGQGPSCPLDPLPLLGQRSSGIPASRSLLGEKGRELAKLAAWLLPLPGERGS